MDTTDSVATSPPPFSLKRSAPDGCSPGERPLNLKGSQFLMPTPPATNGSHDSPTNSMHDFRRELSPAASISTLSSIQDVSSTGRPETQGAGAAHTLDSRPSKKRKLSPTEKAEQQRLKDIKVQEKAAEKARKEEEKRTKDEERRIKDEEKRRKAEEREAKKRERELEDERKNQERQKKERSQMKLGVFFQQPTTTANSDAAELEASPEKQISRGRSLSVDGSEAVQDSIKDPPARISDYRKYFLPYEVKPNVLSHVRPVLAGPELDRAQWRFDKQLSLQSLPEQGEHDVHPSYANVKDRDVHLSATVGDHFLLPIRRGMPHVRTRALFEQVNGSSSQPIDLTKVEQHDPLRRLRSIPMRYLHFHEDLRPAYYGTYTRVDSQASMRKLRRNPFARERTDTNYDYDSEAEWYEEEGDGEGEDIGLDDDDDESVGDDNEMDGFLDDEDDELKARRKIIAGELEHHSTGLCWEDETGKHRLPADTSPSKAMTGLRLQFLLPDFKGASIDPFSTSYWQKTQDTRTPAEPTFLRPPLKERSSNTTSVKLESGWPITEKSQPQTAKKGMKPGAQKSMNSQELDDFRNAIVGSLLGKQELISMLKNLFPNLTAVLVKDTLSEQFAQVGKTKADKKWVWVGGA